MISRTATLVVGGALTIAVSIPMIGRADDKDKKALHDAVVQFAQKQPQAGGPTTHFLTPDDVTIQKGGTVTFVVNGAAHGIAIHPVSKNTTRQDIAEDLCQGGANEADRAGRALVCNGAIVTGVDSIVGTQNLNYDITDGKGNLIIHTGTNVNNSNPRTDDGEHTQRLLATSGRVRTCGTGESEPVCDSTGGNPAGAFLAGSATNAADPTAAVPGNRIQIRFMKTGRYLVICMNRGHSLNDHMFGFVSVVDDDDN
jgi:plastocyanin